MPNSLLGVYPILLTTFKEDGSLDEDSQLRLVDYLLASGAHGLGLFGNASEGYALGEAERLQLLKRIVRHVDGRVPLIVSTGHTGNAVAAAISKQAEDEGAAGLMVLPPYYLKPGPEGLLDYFAGISAKVSIPIMVQDAPLMSQVNLPSPLLARMAREIANVKLVKVEAPPTAPKFTQLAKENTGLTLFGGLNGNFLIEEYERGSRGIMPGSDLIPQFVQMWKWLESGDREAAWKLFVHVLPLIRFELQPGLGVSAMKQNLVARGIIASATVRQPTSQLDKVAGEELTRLRHWVDSYPLPV